MLFSQRINVPLYSLKSETRKSAYELFIKNKQTHIEAKQIFQNSTPEGCSNRELAIVDSNTAAGGQLLLL